MGGHKTFLLMQPKEKQYFRCFGLVVSLKGGHYSPFLSSNPCCDWKKLQISIMAFFK
jgi:hypothetical protein